MGPLPRILLAAGIILASFFSASSRAAMVSGTSEVGTWTCTGSECPWGSQLTGNALVWPSTLGPVSQRLGYTVDRPLYLPAAQANGLTILIEYGSVGLYAGLPGAESHRQIASVGAGGSHLVQGLADGEVLSVQSSSSFGYAFGQPEAAPAPANSSQVVTWSCTASPCPWGSTLQGQAVVWPASAEPIQQRLGYTVSSPIYLPATYANGIDFEVTSGTAFLYAGQPNDEGHRALGTVEAGSGKFRVTGLGTGEVLSVQGSSAFTFAVTRADPAAPGNPSDPPPSGGTGTQSSLLVVWSCGTSPCPWGATLSGQALVWPTDQGALSNRLGYLTSAGIYLPSATAQQVAVEVLTGNVAAYAGEPGASSHRLLGSAGAGQTLSLSGAFAGEVVSVQSDGAFTYRLTTASGGPVDPPPADPPPADGVLHSVPARWSCNAPTCEGNDWWGAVVTWPAWAAYENNARTGSNSRTVYGDNGQMLYPYMGAWAHGCRVDVVSGVVLIIEWQRGTDVWREKWLTAGQSHVINLTSPEDGAMIETVDGNFQPFSVTVSNCSPQHIR